MPPICTKGKHGIGPHVHINHYCPSPPMPRYMRKLSHGGCRLIHRKRRASFHNNSHPSCESVLRGWERGVRWWCMEGKMEGCQCPTSYFPSTTSPRLFAQGPQQSLGGLDVWMDDSSVSHFLLYGCLSFGCVHHPNGTCTTVPLSIRPAQQRGFVPSHLCRAELQIGWSGGCFLCWSMNCCHSWHCRDSDLHSPYPPPPLSLPSTPQEPKIADIVRRWLAGDVSLFPTPGSEMSSDMC